MSDVTRYDDDPVAASVGLPARVRASETAFPDAAWTHAIMRSFATIGTTEINIYGGTEASDRPGVFVIMTAVEITLPGETQDSVKISITGAGAMDDLANSVRSAVRVAEQAAALLRGEVTP